MVIHSPTEQQHQSLTRSEQRFEGKQAPRRRVVIIGNGMVGYHFCRKLAISDRRHLYQLTVIGEEKQAAYNRIRLNELLSDEIKPETISMAAEHWYSQNDIDLHLGDAVVTIDRKEKSVTANSGKKWFYDYLVFATGSYAFMPPIKGLDASEAHVYRTLNDVQEIYKKCQNSNSICLLGGGFISLELAVTLANLGKTVHIVEMAPSLLPRQLNAAGSLNLIKYLQKLGVQVHLSRLSQEITTDSNAKLHLRFDDETYLKVDMVVLAAGIRPRDELARDAGITCGSFGGIVVNQYLQTSDPNIFAIGECVSFQNKNYGLVRPGYQMADVLADLFSYKKNRFTDPAMTFDLKLSGMQVSVVGNVNSNNSIACAYSFQRPDGTYIYRTIVMSDNRLSGAMAIGPWPERTRFENAVVQRKKLGRSSVAAFMGHGYIWSETSGGDAESLPLEAIICSCLGVTKGQICEVLAGGGKNVADVCRLTGASSNCGVCEPMIGALVNPGNRGRKIKTVLILGACAFIATAISVAILFLPPFALSDSANSDKSYFETILLDQEWRRISGFTLLATTLASMILSFRRRILARWLKGQISLWRGVHMGLGIISLGILILHTGFRLGSNWNLILMLTFLGVSMIGGLVSGATAFEALNSDMSRWFRKARQVLYWIHILLVWPLPLLLFFHIFSSYYF